MYLIVYQPSYFVVCCLLDLTDVHGDIMKNILLNLLIY